MITSILACRVSELLSLPHLPFKMTSESPYQLILNLKGVMHQTQTHRSTYDEELAPHHATSSRICHGRSFHSKREHRPKLIYVTADQVTREFLTETFSQVTM
jgi:hypothetical protein